MFAGKNLQLFIPVVIEIKGFSTKNRVSCRAPSSSRLRCAKSAASCTSLDVSSLLNGFTWVEHHLKSSISNWVLNIEVLLPMF
jgi:hypothetical protein